MAAQGILRAAARESFGRWLGILLGGGEKDPGRRLCGCPGRRRGGAVYALAGGAEEWGVGASACAGEWGKWLVPFFSHRGSLFGPLLIASDMYRILFCNQLQNSLTLYIYIYIYIESRYLTPWVQNSYSAPGLIQRAAPFARSASAHHIHPAHVCMRVAR
jgi:hypothetical protein